MFCLLWKRGEERCVVSILNFKINLLALLFSFQVFLQNSLTTSWCPHPHGAYVYFMYFYWLTEQYDGSEGEDPFC